MNIPHEHMAANIIDYLCQMADDDVDAILSKAKQVGPHAVATAVPKETLVDHFERSGCPDVDFSCTRGCFPLLVTNGAATLMFQIEADDTSQTWRRRLN
ncbi:hypothetical protein E0H56_27785 [Rhizobium leguminosarum bv. viciae]|uniref:hypothetical protein n=1 Tax=Rhizobium leguminosarum TaxID=384 RepID=UPI00103CADB1|nr:hypothetical protein [Rhizobium leguminosarum]TBZ86154.1 hypothetical protein E0H56_27785 [Rhizobium leguminosarum bv. viciae]